ncbi:VCBS repeat-containing protein [Opitutia bacterium ISCC 51]|nr:VCBS repeat-containing protein [Opitutae bacterium ISCC 51]QXD26746.1 VCBS repeat-containing protein [Opitutae bacterium ISCC 52]
MKFPHLLALLFICASPLGAALSWQKSSADLGEQTRGIDVADLDGDGQLDLVSTGVNRVFVVRNPLNNKQAEVIADVVDGKLLYGASGDMDGDGDLDFVVARETSPWIDYREKRARREKVKKPKKNVPDFSVAWIENTGTINPKRTEFNLIEKDMHGCHGLELVDINGDGNLDVVGNSIKGDWKDSVAWFDNFAGKFVRHTIVQSNAPVRPHYMDAGDINGDGKPDIVVGHSGGNSLAWYQNPPTMSGIWKLNTITELNGATNAMIADFDGDNRPDVMASAGHGKGVFWFKGPRWQQTTVDADLPDCHTLAIGDFDLDGDMDAASASFSAKQVHWYENNGSGLFTTHDIDVGSGQEAYDLKAVDLNKDGRLDLILAGRNTNNAVWYINQGG